MGVRGCMVLLAAACPPVVLADAIRCNEYLAAIMETAEAQLQTTAEAMPASASCQIELRQDRGGYITEVRFPDCPEATRKSAGAKLFELGRLPLPTESACFDQRVRLMLAPAKSRSGAAGR